MNTAFGYLALAGFALSIIIHIISLAGIDLQKRLPWGVLILHIAVFVVNIPVCIIQFKDTKSPFGIFQGMPFWAIIFILILVVYAFNNFYKTVALEMNMNEGKIISREGKYFFEYNNNRIREFTKDEYRTMRITMLISFSCAWLVFNFLAFAVLILREVA